MGDTGQALRETSDALLRDLEILSTIEEEVAAGEKGDEHPLEHRVLADDHASDLVEHRLGGPAGIDRLVERVARGLGAGGGRGGPLRLTGRVGHLGLRGPVGTGSGLAAGVCADGMGCRAEPRRDR